MENYEMKGSIKLSNQSISTLEKGIWGSCCSTFRDSPAL